MADNQNDPFFRIKDMKKMGLPAWRQWSEFVHVASQDPDWWELSDDDKSEIYKTNFDFEDPREMFKSEEAKSWTPTDLEEVTNAYLSTDRDFTSIQDQNQRRSIKEGLIQSFNEFHMPERVQAEKEAVKKLSPDMSGAANIVGGEAVKKALVPELRAQVEEAERAAEAAAKLSPEEQEAIAKRGIVNLAGSREAEAPEIPETEIVIPQKAMDHYYGRAPEVLTDKAGRPKVIPPSTAEVLGRAEYYRQQAISKDPINPSDRIGAIGVHESSYGVLKMLGLDEQAEETRKMIDAQMQMLPNDFEASGAPEVGYMGEKVISDMFSSEGRDKWLTMIREQGPVMGMMMLSSLPGGAIGQTTKGTIGAWVAQQMAQRIPESGIEAGSAYVAALNSGKSEEEALRAAGIVGSGNLALIAVDGLQALAPMAGASAFTRLASGKITSSGIAGLTKMGGALAGHRAGMESEAFEERFQEGLQMYVEGEASAEDLLPLAIGTKKTERTEEAGKAGRAMAAIMQAPGVAIALPGEGFSGVKAARESREIRDLAKELGTSEANVARDIGAARAAAGRGAVPVDRDAAPAPRGFEADRELGIDQDLESPLAGLEEGRKEYYDSLPEEEQERIYNEAEAEFGQRFSVAMEGYGLEPGQEDMFPDQERAQIRREAHADTLEKHRDETPDQVEAEAPPEPQKATSKAAKPKAGTPAPETPAQEEPATAPAPLMVKDTKPRVKAAKTLEEVEAIEAEWQENGNPESPTMKKEFERARKRVGLEEVAETTDEELGVQKAIGSAAISEQPELAPVRWTDPEGRVIEGTVRHDEDGEQIAILSGDELHYLDPDERVQIFTDYGKPEVEAKPKKKAAKFGGSDMTIDEWAGDYELELGERPTAKKLHDYMTGKTTQTRGLGANKKEVPHITEPLDVTLREVKNALKEEPEVEVETVEVVEPEPEVETAPNVDAETEAEIDTEVAAMPHQEAVIVAGVEIPRPAVEAKPKPKKKRKTLADKVEETEKKDKPKPKKKKKEAQAPVDPAKEAKPTSTKKKKETSARQHAPETLTQDKGGAVKANDLINVIKAAENEEVVEAAWQVYIADVKHGRRKRRSSNIEKAYNNRMDELAGEEFKEDARPVPSPKAEAKPQPKETEDQAVERMERDMDAEWPWHQEESTPEEEYGYFEGLEGDSLVSNLFDEITHRWLKTNGIQDHIDTHFIQQALNEIAQFNPNITDAAEDVLDMLVDEELVDDSRQLRQFLTQEYPGATTLKEATGEAASGVAGAPRTVFSKWLEVADIAQQDAEERRAEALKKTGGKGLTAVQQEKKAEPEEDLEARGEELVEQADEELDEIETKPSAEELKAMAMALRDMGMDEDTSVDAETDPVVEERVKKGYPHLGSDDRPFHVPELADVKRVFKGWEVEELPGGRGFNLTRKSDDMQVRILFTDAFAELKKEFEQDKKLSTMAAFKARFLARIHTKVFSDAQKSGTVRGSKKGAKVPYGTFTTINGIHVITLDSQLSDNITLWHESLHMWLRALATDQEIELVKRVFDTEEEFTGFMSMMLEDEDQAMRMAEGAGASKDEAGLLRSLAKKIFDLSKRFAKVLGYDVSAREAADLAELHKLSRRILYGEAYMAQEQRRRYLQDENTTGLVRNPDGSIYRAGHVRRRTPPAQVDPQSVEFADTERRGASPETLGQVPSEPRPKEQDASTRPGGAEADNHPIVLKKKVDRRLKSLKRWIKQNMRPDRGVDPALRALIIKAVRLAEKGKWRGLAAHNRMKKIIKDLKDVHGEDRINQSLAMVLDGRMSLGQFKRIFNLAADSPAIESLQDVLDYQEEVQDLLFKSESLPQELRKRILANARYQTRFYAVHVLGSGWVTPDEHYITAVDTIVEEFGHQIQRSLDRATESAGKRIQFDFGEYMYASVQRQREITEGLSETRRVMVERVARDLGRWINVIENIRLENGVVVADWTADSIRAHAETTVDGYLDNAVLKGKAVPGPIGGMPVANMMHRKLDKVFRDLYGEIKDPGERLARTMEVQSSLLATATMFQGIFEGGKNVWWSEGRGGEFSKRLSEKEHGGDPSPSDHRRYGVMAGKWVTPEVYDLIHQSGTFTREMDTGLKAFAQFVQGVTRGTRLLWWKTAARNFSTSITGFSAGSGDMLEKGWGRHLKDGSVLAARIARALATGKDPEALETLADLVERDIFDVRQETHLAEVQANLDRLSTEGIKGRALRPLKKLMQGYGLIDLPAKYAAYHVRRDKGDTHEQAVAHLHRFYQYRESVPEFVTKLNRWGFGDYFGYSWDSSRILIEQMKNMVEQGAKGNIRPLFGLMIRLTFPLFRIGTGTAFKIAFPVATVKFAADFGGNVLALIGMEDDDDDEQFKIATPQQVTDLRYSLPSHDRDQPLAVWYELAEDGTWTIKWQVLGNLSAFPLEDVILGALQSSAQDPDRNFGQTLWNNLNNASPLAIGMMPENLYKLFTGNESIIGPRFKEPGLIDVASDYARAKRTGTPMASNTDEIIGNRFYDFIGESFVPGQAFRMLDKIFEVAYGKDPMMGRALSTTDWTDVKDIMFRMVRKYDRNKGTQERVLLEMIRGELKGYENEKWLAGEAGRENLRTIQGATKAEALDSERARENWHTMLKAMEKKVERFRSVSMDNFTDVEIRAILKGTQLRSGEIDHIINGTVETMQAKEFEFDHKPRATQRGDELVIDYFNNNKTVNYKDIHTMLEEAGYIPGEYGPGFRRRVKDLRKDWRKSDK